MTQTMDLWLASNDFRVRSINRIGHGFASTPYGDCVAISTPTHLLALHFSDNIHQTLAELHAAWPSAKFHHSSDVTKLIRLSLTHPEKIAVLAIGTPFQLTIWEFLRSIPCGSTMTYGAVAKAIGLPGAARAVGQAVGANEISLVIPCHRIVSQGKLTGYRWGLNRKKQLLACELTNGNLLA